MAQANNPDFAFFFFGTNNSMTFTDVGIRWKFITIKLKKHGIDVLGYSADGDPRVLKPMMIQTSLGIRSFSNENNLNLLTDIEGFHAKFLPEQISIRSYSP